MQGNIANLMPENLKRKLPGTISAAKITSGKADAYRLAIKHDGELVLQGAFQWSHGTEGGFDWKDIPTVHLDPEGNIITKEEAYSQTYPALD